MIWGALAGGFVGTLVLTTALRAANELGSRGWTCPSCSARRSPPTAPARRRSATRSTSSSGSVFALAYYAIFLAIDESGWLLGALFGLVHALFAGTALVNILLPLVHPRMGTADTAAARRPCSSRPDSCCSTTAGRRRWSRSSPTSPTARSSAASSRSQARRGSPTRNRAGISGGSRGTVLRLGAARRSASRTARARSSRRHPTCAEPAWPAEPSRVRRPVVGRPPAVGRLITRASRRAGSPTSQRRATDRSPRHRDAAQARNSAPRAGTPHRGSRTHAAPRRRGWRSRAG